MLFRNFFLSTLLVISHSGTIELTGKLSLDWCFNSQGEIEFTYKVATSLRDDYGWVGIGFQDPSGQSGMKNSDIVNILFDQPVVDSWSKGNARPDSDISLGGTEDIVDSFSSTESEDTISFTWSRVLDTGDEWDKVFVAGTDLKVLYAWGEVNDEGKQLQHLSGNRGKSQVTFTDDRCAESYLNFLSVYD